MQKIRMVLSLISGACFLFSPWTFSEWNYLQQKETSDSSFTGDIDTDVHTYLRKPLMSILIESRLVWEMFGDDGLSVEFLQ